MTSQVLNFLWLNLDLPAPPDLPDGSIREPLPPRYINNVRKAGEAHPETQVVLWVDSKRLTENACRLKMRSKIPSIRFASRLSARCG